MKSVTRLRVFIGICFFILCLIFLGNLFVPSSTQPFERRYTFVCPLQWAYTAAGIQDADRDFSVNTKLVGMEELNAGKQAQAIHDAVLAKVDGIITAGMEDSEVLQEAIDHAQEQGIPVVLVDNDMPDTKRTCYIGTDNYEAGVMAGEAMYKATEGNARIGILVSSLSAPNQQERLAGFEEAIRAYPDRQVAGVLECHSEKLEVKEKLPQFLEETKIDALYITEAIATSVVGDVMKERQIEPDRMRVIAFDNTNEAISYMEEGLYQALIVQAPYLQGYLAVQTLNDILDGNGIDEIIHTECRYMDQQSSKNQEWSDGGAKWHMY